MCILRKIGFFFFFLALNIQANKSYAQFFCQSSEEIKGKHIREILGEEQYQLNLPFFKLALEGNPQNFEKDMRAINGEIKNIFV